MKLIIDVLVHLARFGVFVGGGLFVLFVLYLLLGPAQRAWEEAQALEERRAELVEERARLRALTEEQELEGMRLRAGLEGARTERDVLTHVRLPQAGLAADFARTRLESATAEAARVRAELMDKLRQDHEEFGVYTGDLRGLPRWIDRQRRQVARVCNLTMLELEFWRRPIANYTASRACDRSMRALRRLDQWGAQVESAMGQVDRVEARAATVREELGALAAQVGLLEAESQELDEREAALRAEEAALRERREATLAELQRLRGEEDAIERALGGFSGWAASQRETLLRSWVWVVDQWRQFWWKGLLLILTVWILPYFWRTLKFWVFAPLLSKARAIQLLPARAEGGVHLHPSERVAAIEVQPGDALLARADHVRQVEVGVSRTRWFYAPSYPFLSYVAGLFMLTEVRSAPERDKPVKVTLAATGEHSADTYVLRIDLQDHPGLVISPRHLIAVSEGLSLTSQWCWGNLHAWARGQLRYISLRGTGSLWIQGFGDVHGETLDGQESHQSGEAYLCFDGRLATRSRRRETFWPYLLGKVPLLEVGMAGDGIFAWQKSTDATGVNPVARAWNAFWSILGKFLGF